MSRLELALMFLAILAIGVAAASLFGGREEEDEDGGSSE